MDQMVFTRALIALGDLLTTYLIRCMHKTFYEEKDWAKENYILMVLIYFIDWGMVFSLNMVGITFLNLVGMVLNYFFPLFICYKVKNVRGITYYIFYVVMNLAVDFVFAGAMGVLKNGMGIESRYEHMTPLVMLAMNLLEIAVVYFICKYGGKARYDKVTKTTWLFLALPCMTLIIVIYEFIALSTGHGGSGNVDQLMQMDVVLMAVNVVVFMMLEKYTSLMRRDIKNREEKIRMESDAEILEIAASAMRERLEASEKIVQADRVMRHDRRHFEALVLTLLRDGKNKEAQTLLEERLSEEPRSLRKYCDNAVLNAALGYYVSKAQEAGIEVRVSCNIPANLKVDEMEFAIVVSNLVENAIHACEKAEGQGFINISTKYKNQLLLEVENSCGDGIQFDEEGHPYTEEQGHGIGTKSILSFAAKTGSEVSYQVKDGRFKVRMIIEA